jgi:aquaporin Z
MNKYLVEFIGTFIFLGVILSVVRQKFVSWATALSIGMALSVVILWGGSISGGHYNPAVSVMFYLNKQLSQNDLMYYIAAQILGGVVALQFANSL